MIINPFSFIIDIIKAKIKLYVCLATIAGLYFFGPGINFNNMFESIKTQIGQISGLNVADLNLDSLKQKLNLDSIKQQLQQFLDQQKK